MNSEKQKGNITSTGWGKFVVNKSNLPDITKASNASDNSQNDVLNSTKNDATKVRNYMLSLESFDSKDLHEKFPDLVANGIISTALYSAMKNGLIRSAGPGKYIVNKTENT